jgi:predicted site-specific integrase-resolvase
LHEFSLRRWEEDGRIEAIRTPSRQRRYDIESYVAKSGGDRRKIVAYARVSGRAGQPDINRLFAALSSLYPPAEMLLRSRYANVAEIGGWLNFKRKKLQALLEQILSGDVRMVVVAYKDRLARKGFDLFRWLCEQNGCDIVVLNDAGLSRDREMVEDILAILHGFSSRIYGIRKYKAQVKEDPDLPKSGA